MPQIGTPQRGGAAPIYPTPVQQTSFRHLPLTVTVPPHPTSVSVVPGVGNISPSGSPGLGRASTAANRSPRGPAYGTPSAVRTRSLRTRCTCFFSRSLVQQRRSGGATSPAATSPSRTRAAPPAQQQTPSPTISSNNNPVSPRQNSAQAPPVSSPVHSGGLMYSSMSNRPGRRESFDPENANRIKYKHTAIFLLFLLAIYVSDSCMCYLFVVAMEERN